jgi:hypothetical protein
VFVDGGLTGVTLGARLFGAAGVLGDAGFEEAVFDEDEGAFCELVAEALMTAGFAGAGLAGGLESAADLSPGVDFVSSAAAGEGDVTGGGVQLGASSGMDGAAMGAGAAAVLDAGAVAGKGAGAVVGTGAGSANGSSARSLAAKETRRTSARPPADAQPLARNVRAVDASTGKKSIEFGPAVSDALRNTSRLGKFTKRRHEGWSMSVGRSATEKLRASAQ